MSRYNDESKQIIEDICYLESLINTEKQEIKQKMISRVSNVNSLDDKAEVISDEVSQVLANMSARISIIEKILSVDQSVSTSLTNVPTKKSELLSKGSNLLDSVKLSIVDIGNRNKLRGLMHSSDNVPYHKLHAGSEVNFVLPINRKIKQTLAISIIDSTPKTVLQDVKLYIDGHKLKHKVRIVNGVTRLICYLPKSKTENTTYVSIQLSDDKYSDLYMSDVNCVPKLSLLSFVKKVLVKKS